MFSRIRPPPAGSPTPKLPFVMALLLASATAGRGAEAETTPEPPPGPAPEDAGVAAGSKVVRHRDWVLDCRADCRAFTETAGAEGAAVLRLVLPGPAEAAALRLETPLPLYLPDLATLRLGARDPVSLPWHTCGPSGCEARAALDPSLLDGLRRERSATVAFTLVDGTRVRLPVSLMGFAAAEAALRAAPPPLTPAEPETPVP